MKNWTWEKHDSAKHYIKEKWIKQQKTILHDYKLGASKAKALKRYIQLIDYRQIESRATFHLQSFFFVIYEFGQFPH